MIDKNLDNEGRILTIRSKVRNDKLEVFWNADTPEKSKEISQDEEIFMYVISCYGKYSSVSLSAEEAETLRDTLDYMIRKIRAFQ